MAKKKSESGSSEKKQTPAKKPATAAATPASAKPAASKPTATTKSASSAPTGAPAIDTSHAANAAAAMIGNKAVGAASGNKPQQQPPQKKESSTFKQLKAGLNKPAAGSLGGAFGIGGKQQKKTKQNYGGGQQIGHNQTFGSDVNRAGVPRRTPG